MKISHFVLTVVFLVLCLSLTAQQNALNGKEVFKNDDVVFHQIDEHTWVGTGNLMFNESLYLVEGNKKAVLIDAGTKIRDLDKIVTSINRKTCYAGSHACSPGSHWNCNQLFL